MDLYQLRYFLEVAREKSFTRAAENLYVSPSAVSRSVALLERSVKRPLFHRTKRRVELTADGETLLGRAKNVFDEVERARVELSGGAAAPAVVRIGSREMITNYLLPGPLALFKKEHPATRFEAFDLDAETLVAGLKKDQLDVGFYYAEVPDPELESVALGRLRSHVYASRSYIKENGPLASLRDVLRQPFIAPRAYGADPSAPRADGFPDRRLRRRIQYEAESLEAHRRFVLAGLCVGVLPDLVMARRRDVVALPGPPIHREIFALRRKGRALPAAVERLPGLVRRAIHLKV